MQKYKLKLKKGKPEQCAPASPEEVTAVAARPSRQLEFDSSAFIGDSPLMDVRFIFSIMIVHIGRI
jgi:hypothetical protein